MCINFFAMGICQKEFEFSLAYGNFKANSPSQIYPHEAPLLIYLAKIRLHLRKRSLRNTKEKVKKAKECKYIPDLHEE